MTFQRGNLCLGAMLAAVSLSACSGNTSHPSKLTGSVLSPSLSPVTASSTAAVQAASTSAPILVTPAESTKASNAGTPTTSPNSSPTATASPTALSSQDIEAGVRATAQEFFDDLNIAFATGDVSKITALTSPACGCRSIVNTIQQTFAQHQRFEGVVATLQSQNVVSYLRSGATVELHFSITAGVVLDADGKQVNTSIGAPAAHSAMFIARDENAWRVEQNTILGSGSK